MNQNPRNAKFSESIHVASPTYILHNLINIHLPTVERRCRFFGGYRINGGPVSQKVWHDKDPSLLKGPERRA
jgi:hypothetical protein